MNTAEEFCKKYDFPEDAVKTFSEAYETVFGNKEAKKVFEEELKVYEENTRFDAQKMFSRIRSLDKITGINSLTLSALMLICMWPNMYKVYEKNNYPAKMVDETMIGFKSGIKECYDLKKVWGSTVPEWVSDFYFLNRFTFGRLQYNFARFKESGNVCGYSFKEGDKYLEVHIPSVGPLDMDKCHASYRECAEFFKDEFDGPVIFGCSSYLLYPENHKILKPASNILKFADEYTIIRSGEDKTNHNYWRIFGAEQIPENLDTVTATTSMQKGYLNWLKQGGTIGYGFGVIVYGKERFEV